jgi:hypothetical protein
VTRAHLRRLLEAYGEQGLPGVEHDLVDEPTAQLSALVVELVVLVDHVVGLLAEQHRISKLAALRSLDLA